MNIMFFRISVAAFFILTVTRSCYSTWQYGPIAIGETVRFKYNVIDDISRSLRIAVCGNTCASSCNVLMSDGINSTNLGFETIRFDEFAVTSRGGSGYYLSEYRGPTDGYQVGDSFVFVVRRRSATQVDIWVESLPEDKATLKVSSNQDQLQIYTLRNTIAFLSQEGRRKRESGDDLAIGERSRLRFSLSDDWNSLYFGMCSNSTCNVVQTSGVNRTYFGYSAVTRNSPYLISGSARWISSRSGPGTSILGEIHVFVVERRSETQLGVWLESNPEDVLALPIDPDQNSLHVKTDGNLIYFMDENESLNEVQC